ncbi:hypothetical protein K320107C7_04910 [Alistipes shahii]|uniref:PKD domain-containing protein n=1 Tax=Alistipes shahii TaxID=328814 RepID=UPI0036F417DA
MKKIISLLCVACLAFAVACSDDKEVDQAFDSVLTPDFTFDDSEEIIAGVDAVQFIDNSKAEGTEISGYFWHFGFAGLGNWSEEAAPAPVMYKDAGEYTVTLTVYGADGNSRSTKRTIVVKAANLAPSASFSYTPETVVVDTEVTFTDTSVDSDGEIVARRWTLPDNTTSTDASVKYTFTKGGTFSVTLRVTDDRGASSEVSKKIFVAGDEGIGSGSEDDPWQIATADRWNEIAQSINGTQPGDYKAGDYYLVTNDVDFSGKNFIAWDSFSGQLTGNGNSLKGITATHTVAEADINEEAAIFGVIRINSGTVKDLKIEATLTSNGNRIGGMTGRNDGTLDGVYFVKGSLTGVKRVGGIAGENNSVIVNCAALGGNISSSGENAGGITGGNTNAKAFVINCYSWMESIVSSGNNIGGIIGYGGSDSFAINCYTTTATVVSGGTYGGAVGYVKKSNLQNIYGNSAVGAAVGGEKNTGSNVPSVWPTQTSRALTSGEMMSGSVSVPSNNTEYGSFVEALNAGVDIFNSATFSQKPEGVVLRRWKSSGTYPVLAD